MGRRRVRSGVGWEIRRALVRHVDPNYLINSWFALAQLSAPAVAAARCTCGLLQARPGGDARQARPLDVVPAPYVARRA
jgi:hypothetical protein